MPVALLQFLVMVAELAAKYGPGLLEVGENLIRAIQSHGDLSPEEKNALIARVHATRADVKSYEPLPPRPTRPE